MRASVVRNWLLGLTLGVGALLLAAPPEAGAPATEADLSTPLYEHRLDEMLDQLAGRQAVAEIDEDVLIDPAANSGDETETAFIFPSGLISACVGSGCVASGCAASGCVGSGCVASGCAASGCAASGCVGSACIASGCGGSACAGSACGDSGCAGSACAGSGCEGICGCVGSACAGSGCEGICGSSLPNGGMQPYAGRGDAAVVAVACPYSTNDDPMADVQVTGFNIERQGDVAEISWVTAGGEVTAFRLYRLSGDHRELVAEGPAMGGRLQRVAAADDDPAAGYVVELVDALGWVTRIGSDGSTERLTELRAEIERPDRSSGLRLSSL